MDVCDIKSNTIENVIRSKRHNTMLSQFELANIVLFFNISDKEIGLASNVVVMCPYWLSGTKYHCSS